MTCYFDQLHNRLVFINQSATPDYWDKHWENNSIVAAAHGARKRNMVLNITKKYLPSGSKIIEGGSGLGQHVYALDKCGYRVTGVDNAPVVISKVKGLFPELQVTVADVRHLPFPDDSFDGYWSLGVIEHFFNGYADILHEMRRVVRPGGYVFVTFPHMSRLRRRKAYRHAYPSLPNGSAAPENFYQFAIDEHAVIAAFQDQGFTLMQQKTLDGLKGWKDETKYFQRPLSALYNGHSPMAIAARLMINPLISWYTSHMILLVFKLGEKALPHYRSQV